MALDIVRIERLVTRKAEDHGGKAKSLARLARAGFPVAPAYVVPGVVSEVKASSASIRMARCKSGSSGLPVVWPSGKSRKAARGGLTARVMSSALVIERVGMPAASI